MNWMKNNEREMEAFNNGSEAAWKSWPQHSLNPYRHGTLEHEAWADGERASFASRQDHHDYNIPIFE